MILSEKADKRLRAEGNKKRQIQQLKEQTMTIIEIMLGVTILPV